MSYSSSAEPNRSCRREKQYNYRQLEDDCPQSPTGRGSSPKPARPPQPKSLGLSRNYSAPDALLIDLSDTDAHRVQKSSAKLQVDPVSLLDSSIAEKYEFLPPPLGEQQKPPNDPFEVTLNIGGFGGSLGLSPMHEFQASEFNTLTDSTVLCGAGRSLVSQAPATAYAASNPGFATAGSVAPPSGACGMKYPSQGPGNLSTGALTSPPLVKEPSPSPDVPPRTYANIPADMLDDVSQKPLPPEPISQHSDRDSGSSWDSGVTDQSNYYSLPPVECPNSMTGGYGENKPVTAAQIYPNTSPADGVKSSSKSGSGNAAKAFEWLGEAVAGYSLQKSTDKNDVNLNRETDKGALNTWSNKEFVAGRNSPKKIVGQSVFYDVDSAQTPYYDDVPNEGGESSGCRASNQLISPLTTSSQPDVKPKTYVGSASAFNAAFEDFDSGRYQNSACRDSSSLPPTLPPRQPIIQESWKQQEKKKSSPYANIPGMHSTIRPVVQDGEQQSHTHYWLLPETQKRLAAIKPFDSTPVDYANIGSHFDGQGAATNEAFMGTPKKENRQPSSGPPAVSPIEYGMIGGVPDRSQITWSGLTGLKPIKPQVAMPTSPQNQYTIDKQVPPPMVASGSSLNVIQGKLEQVQRQVHGVTQEESHAALANNNWDVGSAVTYLKVEQLFRLGIASRDKCRKLLETFKWNLEMAGTVLLDEYSSGSSV